MQIGNAITVSTFSQPCGIISMASEEAMEETASVSRLLEITPCSPFVQLSSRGPRDKVVFSCFNTFQLSQSKDRV